MPSIAERREPLPVGAERELRHPGARRLPAPIADYRSSSQRRSPPSATKRPRPSGLKTTAFGALRRTALRRGSKLSSAQSLTSGSPSVTASVRASGRRSAPTDVGRRSSAPSGLKSTSLMYVPSSCSGATSVRADRNVPELDRVARCRPREQFAVDAECDDRLLGAALQRHPDGLARGRVPEPDRRSSAGRSRPGRLAGMLVAA